MTTGEERSFLDLVDAIVEGRAVDWDLQAFQDERVQRRVLHLRTLERIAALHRAAEVDEIAEDLSGGSWGPLSLRQKIGEGATANVYRAFDTSLEREVALKLGRPSSAGNATASPFQDAWLAEARRLARLRHANVVTVYGVDRFQDRAGIWTELIRGRTLEDILSTQGPFGAREAALIGMDLCRALTAVHGAGLVHRDVKSTNVMREEGGRIVLMDFGIGVDRTSALETTAGSPLYMAPELIAGKPATTSTDLYALGVLMFRILTGIYPYAAGTIDDLQQRQESGERQSLRALRPDIPAPFIHAIEKTLSLDPGERYGAAPDLERALAATLQDTTAVSASRRPRRRRGLLMLAALVPLTGLAVLLLRNSSVTERLSVEANLLRRTPEGDRVLKSGDRVNSGDRLYLEFESSRPVHLYVLNEDTEGRGFLLFPIAGLELQNPLASGMSHRVPGSSAEGWRTWQVDTAGGEETLLLVASPQPLTDLEDAVRKYPRAGSGSRGPTVPPEVVRRLRGMGQLATESDPPPASSRKSLADIVSDLHRNASGSGDIWIRQIHLKNPGR